MLILCSRFFTVLLVVLILGSGTVLANPPSLPIGPKVLPYLQEVSNSPSSDQSVDSTELTLDSQGRVVYKPGEVLGENTFSDTPSETFVFSGDKYELQNEGGQIRVSTFQLKESSTTAQKFELPGTDNKFEISTQGKGFSLIENGDVTAQTDLPIAVKKNSRSLWLVTPTGEKEIRVTPLEAIKKLVRGDVLTKVELIKKEVTFDNNEKQKVGVVKSDVQITDSAAGAYYTIKGNKEVRFLGIIPLDFRVNAKIDVESGRVVDSGTPWFLQNLGFLFSHN